MRPDQERVKNLLTDTVTLLCKNGLHYSKEMKVQGLLGITLDENDVFVVHINETFGDLIGGELTVHADDDTGSLSLSTSGSPDKSKKHHKGHSDAEPPRARKRRNSRDSPLSPSASKHHKDSRGQPATPQSTDSDSSSRVPPLSSPSHSGSAPGTPSDTSSVRIKKEEDVIFLDSDGKQRSSCGGPVRPQSRRDDRNAMQQTYSNLSLSDIQSGFAQLEQVPGVEITGSIDSSGESPAKHKPGDGSGFQPPFVTGMVRNQGSTSEGDSNSGAAWDSSALSNLGQMNPDGTPGGPGSATWDTSQAQNMAANQGGDDSRNNREQNLPYNCTHCCKAFRSTAGFFAHLRSQHNITKAQTSQYLPLSKEKMFACPLPGCGKRFTHDTGLYGHTKSVHNIPYSQLRHML